MRAKRHGPVTLVVIQLYIAQMKLSITLSQLGICFLSIWCFSLSAHAQPGFISATSIDSVVVNSDYVFLGTVKTYEKIEPDQGAPYLWVSFDVTETLKRPQSHELKGEVTTGRYVRFFHPLGQYEFYEQGIGRVKESGSQMFVAVGGETPYAIDLGSDGIKAISADFRALKDKEDLIRAAKEAIARIAPNVKRLHTVTLWKLDSIALNLGQPLRLNVPVDNRLERMTDVLLRSKSALDRSGGLESIRYFKTEKNIARAKELLSDPFQKKLWDTQAADLKPYYSYEVRKSAWNTFRVWGIGIDVPVLREDIE